MGRLLASLCLLSLLSACNRDPDEPLPRPTADLGPPPDPPPESTRCSPTPPTMQLRSELVFEHPSTQTMGILDVVPAADGNVLVAAYARPGSVLFGQTYSDNQVLVLKLSRDGKQLLWRTPALFPVATGWAWVRVNGPEILFASSDIQPNLKGEQVRLARLRDSDGAVLGTLEVPTKTAMRLGALAVAGLPGVSSDITLFAGEYITGTIGAFKATLLRVSPTLTELWRTPHDQNYLTAGSVAASLSQGVDGEALYSVISNASSPYGAGLPAGQAELAQVKVDGKPRWSQRLSYGPTVDKTIYLDPRVDRNISGAAALGTYTTVGGVLGIGARRFQLDGWLWVAAMQGPEVRWVRSACSGTPLLYQLRATPEGGAIITGGIGPEGSLDLGGGVRLPEVGYLTGALFVALYGPAGNIVAQGLIPGMYGLPWKPGQLGPNRRPSFPTGLSPDGKDWLVFLPYSGSDPDLTDNTYRVFRVSTYVP